MMERERKASGPMHLPKSAEPSRGEAWWVRILLPLVAGLWLVELAAPISLLLRAHFSDVRLALAFVGTVVFVGIYLWEVFDNPLTRPTAWRQPRGRRARIWLPFGLLAALSTAMGVSYGSAWLGFFVYTAVGSALRLPTPQVAWMLIGVTLLAGIVGVSEQQRLTDLAQGALLIDGIGASVATVGYAIRTARDLRAARAEVARLAVADERLRFARDLHDLLGHSLSLVALKCDLANQLVEIAPTRAKQEIQDAGRVTRSALHEVRTAVAGYRQPTLASELRCSRPRRQRWPGRCARG
jgi:two-component system sensor histidine kinase DesK